MASSLGPRHKRLCFPLRPLVSGLLGLNLLDALSAIIAERAQDRVADVPWSAGRRLGNYVGQLLDCLGISKPEGRERGGGGRPEDSVWGEGGGGAVAGGGFCATAVGEEFRGELLREEAGQAGLS